jgi:DNA-binding HxlR family transcriptional regulator/peroxiredoxin
VRYTNLAGPDADCAIAQALGVVGDWWTLLVIRDVAGGLRRFDALQAELGVSRKVLAERLRELVAAGVLDRRAYQDRPPRHEYHLTPAGRDLMPVLIALQDWGARHLLGDGSLSATTTADSAETHRVRTLIGATLPELTLTGSDGTPTDPVAGSGWTVLYCFAAAYPPAARTSYPPGWGQIPGAIGCTVESRAFRDREADFAAVHATLRGVSTQRPDELAAFARRERLRFPLLSDAGLQLAGALRLPTFRAGGTDRLKRLTLLVDAERTIRDVLYPIADPQGSVEDALRAVGALDRRRRDDAEAAPSPGVRS